MTCTPPPLCFSPTPLPDQFLSNPLRGAHALLVPPIGMLWYKSTISGLFILTTAHSSSSLLALTVLAINSEIVAKLCNRVNRHYITEMYMVWCMLLRPLQDVTLLLSNAITKLLRGLSCSSKESSSLTSNFTRLLQFDCSHSQTVQYLMWVMSFCSCIRPEQHHQVSSHQDMAYASALT